MEAVNGVSELDKGGPPAPSPLTGCYLLIVVGEPHSKEHKDIILRRIAKGLLSWDSNSCHVDLEKELAIISEQAPEGEDARYGERLIQFASENLVTEVLIHPAISTLSQCMKNLLSSFTRHRHIIHAGYTFAGNGSWILQDGTLSLTDFSEAFQEIEVQRVLRAYDNTISLDIHCSSEGEWGRLPKESFTKNCKLRLNPDDVLTSGSLAIVNFLNYISPFLIPTDIEMLLESSDVVGNIRFSHPTLYVFPGGQGDAALFGINGFNMLVDGGFGRKACFWDFVRHLDRLDAVLLTRLNNSNVNGISSVLRRKRHNTVYPHIGHFFCNIQERKAILSPDGDKDKDPLLINLFEEGQDIMNNLRQLNLQPQSCYRDIMPMNLYHKVGHGTLDMYILSPSRDSKEVKEFLQKWSNNDHRLFSTQKNGKEFVFPTYNLVSICALLVWQPANLNDNITRILFPGSSPQHKIFEGLDKLKQLEAIKYPSCSAKTLTSTIIKTKLTKTEKIVQDHKEIKQKSVIDGKPKMENKIIDEDIKNGHTNGITQPISEKIIKKHDSTESEKSGTQIIDTKKLEITKDLVNGKTTDDKIDKFKAKPKPEPKIKPEMKTNKNARSLERRTRPPVSAEKKASPTTPKKTVETKINGDATRIKPATKISPSATPAKSAKDANNRKVVESKIKAAPKREAPKPGEKKETKPERKPISRRPKGTSPVGKTPESPIKKVMELHKFEARKPKLEKECTTDSSTVSTPSADVESTVKKDLSKLTPEEIEQLKARELAELKEEQEVVKEIEAVFRKSESKDTDDSDMRKIKNISIDEKTEGEGEEYLIIEKEEMDHDSLDEKDAKESETQKHLRDSEESEKQRKLSDVIESVDVKEKPTEDVKTEIVQEQEMIPIIHSKEEKELPKAISKEVSVTSPTDKIEESSGKKITDREIEEEIKDINILESQPDEKFSTPIESGATTAPTLPEDERIPLDEIKEDNGDLGVEEKYVKEDTKEKEVPVVQLPPKTIENVAKIPTVVGIRLDKQTPMRDIVKTPDEVADLPVHEEVDIENYEQYQANQAHTPKQGEPKLLPTKIKTDEVDIPDNESAVKAAEVEICEKIDEEKHDAQKITDKSDVVADKVIVQDDVVTPALEDNKLTEKQLEHEGPQTTAPSHETEIEEPAEIKSAKVLIESKPTLVESVEKTDMEKDVPAKEVELKDDKSIDELKKLEEEIVDANKLVIEDENKGAPKDDAIETVIEKGIGKVSDITAQTLKETTELEDESPYESRRVEVSMERTEVKIEKIHGAKSDKTKETVEEDEKDKDTTEDLKTDIEQVEEIQLAEKVQLVEAQELMQEVKEDIQKIQSDLIDAMDDEGAGKDIVIDALKSAEETVDSVCKAIQDDVEKVTKVEEPAVEVKEVLELDSEKEHIVDAIQDDVEKTTKVEEPAVEVKEVLELDSKKEQIVDAIQDDVEKTTKVDEPAVEVKEVLELDSKKEQIVDAIQDDVEKVTKVEEPAVEVKEVLELDSKKEQIVEAIQDDVEKTTKVEEPVVEVKEVLELDSKKEQIVDAIQDDVEKMTKVEEPAVEIKELLELDSKKEQIVDAIQGGVEKTSKVEEPAVEVKDVLELDSKKEQIVDAIQDDVEKITKVEEPAVEVKDVLELDSKKEQIVDAIQDDVEKITKVEEPAVEVKAVLELDSKKEQIVDAIQGDVEKITKVEEPAVEVKAVLELDSKKEQIVDAIQGDVEKITKVEEPGVEATEVLELDSKKETESEETKDKQFAVQSEEEIKKDTILPTESSKEELKSSEGEVAEQKEPIVENGLDLPEDDAIAEIKEASPVAEPESKKSDPIEIKLEKEVLDDTVIVTEEGDAEETIDDHEAVIRSVREDSLKISKIDKKLQELKESVESDTKSESKEPALIKAELDLVDKLELGRKSPKEREQDVAKIVASVAEVLKSDAPLEEFEGKIPLDVGTFSTFAPYTTELRETHITTLESPIRDIVVESMVMEPIEEEKFAPSDATTMFINEEKRIASVHTDYDTEFIHKEPSRVSSLLKDSNDLIQATSKMISDIKHTSKVDDKTSQALEDISAAEQEANVKEVQKSPLSSGKISPNLKDTTLVDKIVPEETKTDEESKDVAKIVAKDELEKTLIVEEKADDIETEMLDTIPVKEEASLVESTTGLESGKGDDPLHPSEQSVIVSESEIKKQTVTEIETEKEKIDVAEGDIQQEHLEKKERSPEVKDEIKEEKEVIVVKEQLATEERREIKETTEEKELISKNGAEEIVLTTDKEIKQDKSSVVAKEDITAPKKQTEEDEDEVQVNKVRGEEKQAKSEEDITIDEKVVIGGKAAAKELHEAEKVATTESVIAEDKATKEKIHVTLDEKDVIVEEEKGRIDETTITYVEEDKMDIELKEKVEKEQVTEKTDVKEEKVEFIDEVTKEKERIDDNACIEGKIVKEADKQSSDDKVVDDHKKAAEKIEIQEQGGKDEMEATEDKSAIQEKEVAHEKEVLKDEDKVITKEKEVEEEKGITADKEERLDKKVVEKDEKITSEDIISADKKEIEVVKATVVEKGERLEETTIKEGVEVDEGEMKHDKITAVETHMAMEKEAEVKEITTKEKLTTVETESKDVIHEDKIDTGTKEEKLITEDKADTEMKGVKEKEVTEEKTRIETQGILIGDQQTGDEKMATEEKEIEEGKSVVQTIQTAEEKLTTEEKPIMPKEDITEHKISIEDEETVEPAKEKVEEKELSEAKSTEKGATVEDKVVTEEKMKSKTEEQATICEKEREKLTTDLKEPTIEKEEGVEKITSLPLDATKLDEKSTQDLAETHVEIGTISELKESQSAIQLPSTITEGDSKSKEVEESKKVDASPKSISSTEAIGFTGKVADITSKLEMTVRKDSKGVDIEDSKEIVEGTKDIEEVSMEKVTPSQSPDLKSTETVLPHSEKSPAEIIEKEADKIAPPTSSISDVKEKSSHLSGTSSPVSTEKVTPPDSPDLKSTETVLPHSEKSPTEIIEKEADRIAPPTSSISDAKEKSSPLSGKSSPVSAVEETLSEGKDGLEQKTSAQQELEHHLSSVADDLLSVDPKDKDIDIVTEGQKDKSPIISRTASPNGKVDDKDTQTTPSEKKDSISLEKMTPKLQEEQKHVGAKEEESEYIPHEVVDKEVTEVVKLEKDFEVESKSAEIPLKDTVAKVEEKEGEESDRVPHEEDSKMVITVPDVATSIKRETSPDLIDGHAKSEKITQEPHLETKQEECAKLIKSSDKLLQELKSEIHEKLGEQKIESSTLQYPSTEEVKEKSQMSSGKVSPDVTVKEVLAAEKCITPPESKSSSRSGKTSPVIMLEGKETSVPSDKPILFTEKYEKPSDQSSGRSSPEIVELTKDLLDTKHSPIISRKSTPEIIVDNEFVDSDRLSPEIAVVETEKEDAEVGSQMIHITESVSEVPKSGIESKDATDVPGVPPTDVKTEYIQEVVSESQGTDSVEPSLSIVSEASTSAETKIEISDVVKEGTDLSSGRTTPPTAPVSPICKDKPASFNDKSVEKKEVDVLVSKAVDRSATPASDDCDISSGQVSRVLTTEEDDDKQVYSDDEEIPGSPLSATSQIAHSISSQYDFEDSVRGAVVMDPMSTSFYGALPDDPIDLNKEIKATRIEDSHGSPSHIYEITTARFTNIQLQEELEKEARLEPKPDIMTASFIGSELPSDPKDDPIASWGKPLGLPSPAPLNDNKGTPKKEKKILTNVMFKNRLNEDKKSKKVNPVYVDLTYVPHNGNSNYSYVDFFKRVRARYYVFSGIEPSKEVYSALLEAKQTWDDKDLEVTIIPTYDTDVLGYWVAENEDLLAKYKIDLSPSASRCTINLQDHETSCSAYRLEFS